MLLRMLDYTTADVGPIWPNDYVVKAQSLGLTKGAASHGVNDPITRADAAIMLRNTLRTPTKGGEKLYTALSGSTPVENSILLATPETDSSLQAGQLRFYEGGQIVTRPAANSIDSALVGARGVVLFDKTATNKVKSFLPEVSERETYTVVRAERQQIVTKEGGQIAVGRKVPVVVQGALQDYIEAWFDIRQGQKVNLYYDKDHNLELIAVDNAFVSGDSYVWGVDTVAIPKGYRVERNGATIQEGDIQKYDVVTLDPSTQTALVSNTRITGVYQEATPSFRFPEKVKVLATEFPVSEKAAPTFDNTELGKKVTLLFDVSGQVRAAVPESELSASMNGIVTATTESEVTVQLFNGLTIKGPIEKAVKSVAVGQMVRLSQDTNGNLRVTEATRTTTNPGDWIVSRGVLGSKPVAPDVQVFERVSDNGPLNPLKLEDIKNDVISGKNIETVVTDPSGTVTALIIRDATGESWVWGLVEGASVVVEERVVGADPNVEGSGIVIPIYDYKVKITTLEDGKPKTYTIDVVDQVDDLVGKPTPLGLPRAALSNTGEMNLISKKPIRVGAVTLQAFDGYQSVKTDAGVYPIADDVPVFVSRTNQLITLRQAKADYDAFVLYADAPLSEGGRICMISVS